MRLNEKHIEAIEELEAKYGSLNNVPEDNKKLLRIRKQLSENDGAVQIDEKTNKAISNGNYLEVTRNMDPLRYNYRSILAIFEMFKEGIPFKIISDKFGVSNSFVTSLFRGLEITRRRKYVAILADTNERMESYELQPLIKRLNQTGRYSLINASRARYALTNGTLIDKRIHMEAIYECNVESDFEVAKAILHSVAKKSKLSKYELVKRLNTVNRSRIFTNEMI